MRRSKQELFVHVPGTGRNVGREAMAAKSRLEFYLLRPVVVSGTHGSKDCGRIYKNARPVELMQRLGRAHVSHSRTPSHSAT